MQDCIAHDLTLVVMCRLGHFLFKNPFYRPHRRLDSSPGGLLRSKSVMGMCRWMGSHFHNWIDYNEVTFLVELLMDLIE